MFCGRSDYFGRPSSAVYDAASPGMVERHVHFVDGTFVRQIALIPFALLCMSTVAILQKRAASVESSVMS